jgi:histidinol-phosphate phosphatase family protein
MTNRAVFLDRDGTINEEVNYLNKEDQVKILPGSAKAIKILNEHGYKVIIITNQSGVARGYLSIQKLEEINKHLKSELLKEGAIIDAIYYCPHHPDEGCDCRKPNTKLLERAAEDLDIDFTSSYIVGDKLNDLKTGKKVGCGTVLVLTGYGKTEFKELEKLDFKPNHIAENLYHAVLWITNNG